MSPLFAGLFSSGVNIFLSTASEASETMFPKYKLVTPAALTLSIWFFPFFFNLEVFLIFIE